VARRPAGPPAGGAAVIVTTGHDTHDDQDQDSHLEPGSDGAGRVEQAHVPVKKKGRR
jgi:hypothetical protein